MTDDTAPDLRPLLTIGQVASRLSMSVPFVRRAIESGDLESLRLSPRTIRIRPAAVEQYVARRRTIARSELSP